MENAIRIFVFIIVKCVCAFEIQDLIPKFLRRGSVLILCRQTKRIYVGDGVAVGVGVAVEGDGLRDLAGDDIRVDESPQLGAVVPGSHVDESVGIRDHAVPAVVAEDDKGIADAAQKLACHV